MAIMHLKWEVGNLSTLLDDGYDLLKIEKDSVEQTRVNTRLPLVENSPLFAWICPVGAEADTYEYVPYRSSDDTDGTSVEITDKKLYGYCTIQDIRDEGFTVSLYSDARVQTAIDSATRLIEDICGQRFLPYYASQKFDVKQSYSESHFDVPLAAVYQIVDVSDPTDFLPLDSISIYNRHLTDGLREPDDRKNPMIGWQNDRTDNTINNKRVSIFDYGRFYRGRKTLLVKAIWGYTEIGPGDSVGETEDASQFPLSLGQTPNDIKRACMLLAIDRMPTLYNQQGGNPSQASRVIEEKTRDQSYKLSPLAGADASYGMTGNLEVDNILQRYPAPLGMTGV